MPSRNILKIHIPESFYHIYARGNSRREIFVDDEDYATFLNLLKRYLSAAQAKDSHGVPYPHLYNSMELLCFCLMPNHFHLLIYQKEEGAMTKLMQGVMTSYSRYFNKKYGRSGPLLESRYKASRIITQSYLEHITRYIHINPDEWQSYKYSSLPFYLGKQSAEWLAPKRVLALFASSKEYENFLKDYKAHKKMLDEIKYELANHITT